MACGSKESKCPSLKRLGHLNIYYWSCAPISLGNRVSLIVDTIALKVNVNIPIANTLI